MSEPGLNPMQTRASIFLRLKATDPEPREMAWSEFRQKYVPVIAGFAHKLGARPQDVDDVIQDVFLGFFSVSPKFVYDPSKGRFRGYLKTLTLNAIRARFGREARINTVPLTELADDSEPLETTWQETWRHQQLRMALESIRSSSAEDSQTYQAFELYVLRDEPAAEVARKLGISIDSVYQAKHRITAALKSRLAELENEDD